MKKSAFFLSVFLFVFFVYVQGAVAALVFFEPRNVSTKQGEFFDLKLKVNSQNIIIYTTKIVVEYPVDLIDARSFAFSPGWQPIDQPIYDKIDNQRGVVMKTGTFGSGTSGLVDFGSIRFYAKKADIGEINLRIGSEILDKDSENILAEPYPKAIMEIKSVPGFKPDLNQNAQVDKPIAKSINNKVQNLIEFSITPFFENNPTAKLVLLVFAIVVITCLALIIKVYIRWRRYNKEQ